VINLRGTIVPVIDLRLRFGLDPQDYGKETVVIVVRALLGDDAERSLGLVVDAVSDVMMARDEDVVSTPEFGAEVRTENITGLVSLNGQMVMILDIPGLFEVGTESSG
jgi:purine-binding chemotaxis protein CheW